MVQLHISEPIWSDKEDDESVNQRISLLSMLESSIRSLMFSGGRSEARLWLCNSLSGISSITRRNQRELFINLLKSKPLKQDLAAQLLHMFFEKKPHEAGSIIAKKSYMLENFFRGYPRRILQWFSNFAGSGDLEHRKGAKALSQFAFVNRDICWEELEWKGKHGQSPAMVATKPHYFLDLDVQRTVENFLEYVPEFWSSSEFAESLRGGEILFMDPKFFVNIFLDLMYKEDLKEIWDAINELLMEESFSSLCHHLLIVLEERDLCVFLDLSRKFININKECMDFGFSSYWLEIILSEFNGSDYFDQLLLLNAVISQGRQLLRLVREEEAQEDKEKIQDIVLQLCTSSSHPNSLAPLMKECFNTKSIDSIKWLGLQSWVFHYRLAEELLTPESCKSLFRKNGIAFHKSDTYELLCPSGFSEEITSDSKERPSLRVKRKKKEKRRKKRRSRLDHHNSDNEILDLDFSDDSLGLQSKSCSWLLSTDGYSTAWSIMDLPDHLSKHCFSMWMKWLYVKWKTVD